MKIVNVQPLPSQSFTIILAGQSLQLNIYQKSTGMFCDIYNNNVLTIAGVICQNCNRIVRDEYFGIIGDFIFYDTQGVNDPEYSQLGSRYLLLYIEAGDNPQGVF